MWMCSSLIPHRYQRVGHRTQANELFYCCWRLFAYRVQRQESICILTIHIGAVKNHRSCWKCSLHVHIARGKVGCSWNDGRKHRSAGLLSGRKRYCRKKVQRNWRRLDDLRYKQRFRFGCWSDERTSRYLNWVKRPKTNLGTLLEGDECLEYSRVWHK